MILIIDNYDSFVHNLARYIRELGYAELIKRNDAITIAEIETLNPSHIILSPGPCKPNDAGITVSVIRHFAKTIPILGVCLGHQAIGEAFGGEICRAIYPTHGKASLIKHNNTGIFNNLPSPLKVGLYHSLAIDKNHLPKELSITATTEDGEIMAIQHQIHPTIGVQFHPESILTDYGYQLLNNFCTIQGPQS